MAEQFLQRRPSDGHLPDVPGGAGQSAARGCQRSIGYDVQKKLAEVPKSCAGTKLNFALDAVDGVDGEWPYGG